MTKPLRRIVCLLCFACFLCSAIPSAADGHRDLWVRIDLWERRLYLMEGNEVVESFPIAAGRERYPSPIGTWKVINKDRDWGGGFGACWLGLNVPWGTYGIHGTNRPGSIGHDASHGCIRMLNPDIRRLYERVRVGTTVVIEGPLLGHNNWKLKTLVRGSRGTLVMIVQNRLQAAGYYEGPIDGIFGFGLERAVKRYQRDNRLPVTGQIQTPEYVELGLLE